MVKNMISVLLLFMLTGCLLFESGGRAEHETPNLPKSLTRRARIAEFRKQVDLINKLEPALESEIERFRRMEQPRRRNWAYELYSDCTVENERKLMEFRKRRNVLLAKMFDVRLEETRRWGK